MRLIAQMHFTYDRRAYNPGDTLDVPNSLHGRILVQGGRAKELENRAMQPKAEKPQEDKPEKKKPRSGSRRYLRRDMVAED